jgi:nascent polypeptide-associated complex subunit alpha
MFPGGRMNPKQMQAAMRRMGISQEEMQDVEEVVIKTRSKEIVFKDASVTKVVMQGQTTYQLMGTPEERERKAAQAAEAPPRRPYSRSWHPDDAAKPRKRL